MAAIKLLASIDNTVSEYKDLSGSQQGFFFVFLYRILYYYYHYHYHYCHYHYNNNNNNNNNNNKILYSAVS